MIKTLSQALRMDKERFKVPKSVQQAIPIQRIWPDGIFQQGTKFSKTYRFTDINYYIASKDNKTEMFLIKQTYWCGILHKIVQKF